MENEELNRIRSLIDSVKEKIKQKPEPSFKQCVSSESSLALIRNLISIFFLKSSLVAKNNDEKGRENLPICVQRSGESGFVWSKQVKCCSVVVYSVAAEALLHSQYGTVWNCWVSRGPSYSAFTFKQCSL